MSEDVWSDQDTTPDKIDAALRRLLYQRHQAQGDLFPARVLNLVVVVDRDLKGEIANRLERVGRYHASRTILCAVEQGRTTLDAVAVIHYDRRPGSTPCAMQEQVEIDLGPEHLAALETIVSPVLGAELTTMLWSPHGYEEAVTALLPIIDAILLDADDEDGTEAGLARSAELLDDAYVVDLAWLRTTPWRERLAASFDPPERRDALGMVKEVSIRHRPSSEASAALLAGWLASRLSWNACRLEGATGRGRSGPAAAEGQRDEVRVILEPHGQDSPGLAGVTVAWGNRCALSLDRSIGGLLARQTGGDHDREWRVLGASRGEAGILGEGVRQALLRDSTYGPALAAAREMCH